MTHVSKSHPSLKRKRVHVFELFLDAEPVCLVLLCYSTITWHQRQSYFNVAVHDLHILQLHPAIKFRPSKAARCWGARW